MSVMTPSLETQVLDNSPLGVLITDTDNHISWINQTMLGFLGCDANSLIGLDLDTLEQTYRQYAANDAPVWKVINNSTGVERSLLLVSKEISTGICAWYFSDATELMRLREENSLMLEQLESTATSDPITGILNRRALLQALEPQVSRSRRYNNPLSAIVLEINKFESSEKDVTPVTEHVLRGIGFYLRDQMRWVDLVGRTAEGEFTLVLPETGIESARNIGRKIHERLLELNLPDIPDITVKVNARIGFSEWQYGDDSIRLLDRARTTMQDLEATA